MSPWCFVPLYCVNKVVEEKRQSAACGSHPHLCAWQKDLICCVEWTVTSWALLLLLLLLSLLLLLLLPAQWGDELLVVSDNLASHCLALFNPLISLQLHCSPLQSIISWCGRCQPHFKHLAAGLCALYACTLWPQPQSIHHCLSHDTLFPWLQANLWTRITEVLFLNFSRHIGLQWQPLPFPKHSKISKCSRAR